MTDKFISFRTLPMFNIKPTDFQYKPWIKSVSGFLVSFIVLIAYQFYVNQNEFYGDANLYYEFSKSFFGDNHNFSFLNFPRQFRGYFFPFMFSPITYFQIITNGILNEFTTYRIYLSILYGATFGTLIPSLYTYLFGKEVSLIKRVILLLLVIFFWGGFFIHPLTEIPVIVTLMIAIYSFSKMINETNIWKLILYGIISGIFICGTYNIRTINIVFFIIFPIIFLIYGRGRSFKLNVIGALACTLGLMISFYPQLIINKNNYEYSTPLVYAGDTHNGLFIPQLYRGLNTIRWQPYLGEEELFPQGKSDGLRFLDNVGSVIWSTVKGKASIKGYLILMSQYPLDFIRIYFQHFVSALDIRWNSDYVYDAYTVNNLFALLNFSLWYIAFFFSSQVFQFSENLFSKKNILFLFLIPPSLASLPAPTESRYYLTMYIYMYVHLIYNTNWKEIKSHIIKYPKKILLSYIAFLIFMFSISGMILGNLKNSPIFLSGPSDYSIYFEILLDRIIK